MKNTLQSQTQNLITVIIKACKAEDTRSLRSALSKRIFNFLSMQDIKQVEATQTKVREKVLKVEAAVEQLKLRKENINSAKISKITGMSTVTVFKYLSNSKYANIFKKNKLYETYRTSKIRKTIEEIEKLKKKQDISLGIYPGDIKSVHIITVRKHLKILGYKILTQRESEKMRSANSPEVLKIVQSINEAIKKLIKEKQTIDVPNLAKATGLDKKVIRKHFG